MIIRQLKILGSIVSVLNIVMQLRKVCNHPNLFEPRQVQTPFCVEIPPFRPFCRQLLTNGNGEFEQAILHLTDLDRNLKSKGSFSNLTVSRSGDRILDRLRLDLLDRVHSQIAHFKETWTQDVLNK